MSRLTLALLGALRLATAASTFLSGFYTGHDVLSSSLEQLVLPSLAPGNVEAPQLHANVEVLAPGLVIIRGAISAEDQQILASSAHRLGKRRDGGFLNAAEGRGRIYDKATRLPGCFRRLCGKAVVAARASDDAMPSMTPSHVLVNKYTSSKGLLWHRDIYDNDGDGEHPASTSCALSLSPLLVPLIASLYLSHPCPFPLPRVRSSTSLSARRASSVSRFP